jgi:hypothetical protein
MLAAECRGGKVLSARIWISKLRGVGKSRFMHKTIEPTILYFGTNEKRQRLIVITD